VLVLVELPGEPVSLPVLDGVGVEPVDDEGVVPVALPELLLCAEPPVELELPMELPLTALIVIEADAEEAGPVPTTFVATAVNMYAVPAVRLETVIGEEAPV